MLMSVFRALVKNLIKESFDTFVVLQLLIKLF